MLWEQNSSIERIGKGMGYVFAYFLFTSGLFLILTWLDKLPWNWDYFHIMGITILIVLLGKIFKRILK